MSCLFLYHVFPFYCPLACHTAIVEWKQHSQLLEVLKPFPCHKTEVVFCWIHIVESYVVLNAPLRLQEKKKKKKNIVHSRKHWLALHQITII